MRFTASKVIGICTVSSLLWFVCAAGCRPSSSGGEQGGSPPAQSAGPTDTATSPPTATETASAVNTRAAASRVPPWTLEPAAGMGAIVGHVSYAGTPPKAREINFGPEKKCHEGHTTPPTDETLVVAGDGSIRWALVHITNKVPGEYPPPTDQATLDQKGCVFIPHILAVFAGQPINVLNSDAVAHNVRCESSRNPSVNFILPSKGDTSNIHFDQAEVGIKLKCDIHFWMNGYIHVMRHPFFHVTGADGWYKIENLPPGEYKLEAWQEKLGKENEKVIVKEGEVLTVDFVFAAK